jgi:hypothetical protein
MYGMIHLFWQNDKYLSFTLQNCKMHGTTLLSYETVFTNAKAGMESLSAQQKENIKKVTKISLP